MVGACSSDTDRVAADASSPPTTAEPTTTGPTTTEPPATRDDGPTEPSPEPAGPPGDELEVHFLDVGQGDATLLRTADTAILVDTGRHDRRDVLGHLQRLGVDSLDLVAITHGHADHIGQLDVLLPAMPVEEVWMSGSLANSQTFGRALDAVEASDAFYEEPRTGDAATFGSLEVEVLHPASIGGDLHGDSLVLRVAHGGVRFLFTGDAEDDVERRLLAGDVAAEVYQVGHHGSRTSSTQGFLEAVSPSVAVYSAGEGNSYGHPHPEVITRLEAAGIEVYGTDRHGTVVVVSDGTGIEVRTDGAPRGPPGGPGASAAAPAPTTAAPAPAPPPAGAAGCAPGQVDLNSAPPPELERIIHLGPARAGQVPGLRPFARVEDLERVSGIGPARLADVLAQGVACV